MGCSASLYEMIMPSSEDTKNHGALEVFETIILERLFKKALTVCTITIEAGNKPGATILCETYKSHRLRERSWVEFPSIDAAVVEAGRLVHNKMRTGFHYRLASPDESFGNSAPIVMN